LACLFDTSEVVVREATLKSAGWLYPEEEPLAAGCVERRRREIVVSRTCARLALTELGVGRFPLLAMPDRAPMWPSEVVGSITHTDGCIDGYCGVAVADRRYASGLGVDAEPATELPDDIWNAVLDADERQAALVSRSPGLHARLVFSAKEATYKAIYPALKRFLQFSDVHVDVLPQGRFLAVLTPSSGLCPSSSPLVGHYVMAQDLMVTGMLVRPTGLPLAQEAMTLHHVPC
jgi:4'-phosphopantetheinyl transferase EntD